jgi:hypothetical protein
MLTQIKLSIKLRDKSFIKIEAIDTEMTSKLIMVQVVHKDKQRYQHFLIDETLTESSIEKIPIHLARLMICH